MFSPDKWFGVEESFYNGAISTSQRFGPVNGSKYMNKTFSGGTSTGAGAVCTVSVWVRRNEITNTGYNQWFFCAGASSPAWLLGFRASNDELEFTDDDGSPKLHVNKAFRDIGKWYHIVLRINTSESSNADKYQIWVNGVRETDVTLTGTPTATLIGTNVVHDIGRYPTGSSYANVSLADLNVVDGLALDASYFGEFKNEVWIPKEPVVSEYGTNGFRLEFKQTGTSTDASGMGADTSGKGNHFASSGLNVSDGALPDCPENTFSVLNSAIRPYTTTAAETISDGNLNAYFNSSGVSGSYWSTFFLTKGKWYFEVNVIAAGGNADVGISNKPSNAGRGTFTSDARGNGYFYQKDGQKGIDNTFSSYGATYTTGDIIGCAFDLDNNTIEFYKNNSSQGQITGVATTEDGYIPAIEGFNGTRLIANFGQDSGFSANETAQGNSDNNGVGDFYYSPPSGYLAICSKNLEDTTIGANSPNQSTAFFSTTLYTSNNIGAGGTQNVTGVGFQPDLVWIKNRTSNSTSHTWYDSTRGTGRHIASDSTSAEVGPNSIYGYLSAFGADGFTLTGGTTNANYINQSTDNYVSWNFKANGGTTTTNDASSTGIGTIDSVIQADDTAGFSIVSYTGTQTLGSVKHGLSTAPNLVLIKNRSSSPNGQWVVGQDQSGFTGQLYFDDGPFGSNAGSFNNTAPTTSVVTINTDNTTNENGDSFIMYCFSNRDGYLKVGSYEGNNNSDGTFIYTGFKPAFLLVKNLDTNGENFHIFDDIRAPGNVIKARLIADGSAAENTNDEIIDFLSNGFKWRDNNAGYNNAATFVYLAIARESFKYANAR